MSLPTLSPDTAALVEGLERFSTLVGTVELFDALVAESSEQVAAAIGAHPSHPMSAAVLAWLAERGVAGARPPTVAEVLAKHGIVDLEAHLVAESKRVATLQTGLNAAWERADRGEAAANAYAAVLVLCVGLALLGWAAALGVVPILDPENTAAEPPSPVRTGDKLPPATAR